jgi:hypothetical protein
VEPHQDGKEGNRCFLETAPLKETKQLAADYGCDIGVPNDAGVGNILMYTRVVDDLAKKLGHPLKILTAPLSPAIGVVDGEDPFPLWRHNPFVDSIVDAESIDPQIMVAINRERDNLCQFSHMIENIAYHYGMRPRCLRPSLYLNATEAKEAMHQLRDFRRPIVCIHPHGTSSPKQGHPWYERNWRTLIERISPNATILEIFKEGSDTKQLETVKIKTSLRQMMALVWASDLFVGFDSSVAHVATAFELPALVLWDPIRKVEIEEQWQTGFAAAALARWSYPQNRNLVILGDRDNTILNLVEVWVRTTLKLLAA